MTTIRNKTVCVVTGSRAEYGLLHWFMHEVQSASELRLQTLVTGMHLSEKYGATWKQIEADGFEISARVDMLEPDNSSLAVARSTGAGVSGCANALAKLKPDLIVVLGDRFESFAAAVAATFLKIPVAHFHGGETTEGAFDESLRHCITKMSHLHFTSTEDYRRRVIQLGEDPDRVFNVGAVGLDNADRCQLLSRDEMEASTGIKFLKQNIIVTFHPVTLEHQTASSQFKELTAALDQLPNVGVIITHPNADPGSDAITEEILQFKQRNQDRVWHFKSLGFIRYLSALQIVDAVVGNSSSGLIEAPHFRTPTINIGNRQKGRIAGSTVIQCEPEQKSILSAIEEACSSEFKASIASANNPYGLPGASKLAAEIIRQSSLDGILLKHFHDAIPASNSLSDSD